MCLEVTDVWVHVRMSIYEPFNYEQFDDYPNILSVTAERGALPELGG